MKKKVVAAVGVVAVLGLFVAVGWYWFFMRGEIVFADAFENPAEFHVYEGFPKDKGLYAMADREAKKMYTPQGLAYAQPLAIEPELAKELGDLVVRDMRRGALREPEWQLACTFHLDYMLEAVSASGDRCLFLMCFTCGEVRIYVNGKQLSVCYPDQSEFKALLRGRVNQRPLAKEWLEEFKDQVKGAERFWLYKGAPASNEAMLKEEGEVAGALGLNAIQMDSVKTAVIDGMEALPQEGGKIVFPEGEFHADYVLRWKMPYGGMFHVSIDAERGTVHFSDHNDLRIMRLSGEAKEKLRVLVGDLKMGENVVK